VIKNVTRVLKFLVVGIVLSMNMHAFADTLSDRPIVAASLQQDAPQKSLSLSDLDDLIAEDDNRRPTFDRKVITDLAALSAFLTLAMVSFFMKSRPLKYATMVVAVAYMGFVKSNLVSIVHLFGLMNLSFPIFEYNLTWYLLMAFTIVSTVFWGRLYCGRICAFGAMTQLMDRILPAKLRFELPKHIDRRAIYVKYVLLFAVLGYFFITQDNTIYKYVEPFWMFTLSGTTVMWMLLGILLLTTVFIRNFYCRYLCMVGAGLGLMSNLTVFGIKRWKQCNTCKLCENLCEWGAINGPNRCTMDTRLLFTKPI
jgi:hypothetical protein